RILGGSSSPIHLAFEEHPRQADGTIWARHDFPVTPNACGAAQRYAREAENRRAEEERNRVRLIAPLGTASQ
ncbi:MAG: hypothetical protein LC732_10810, partial [Acidobacteria bacterium]|nr:hypothetical protein [Acidobacteriota bacterium]